MKGSEAIKLCDHWSLKENWGCPDLVDPHLIYLSHDYRIYLGSPLYISPVNGAVYSKSGHASKSWHKIIDGRNTLSMAMDVFPACDLAYAWITAMRFDFGGIGVYPYYKYPAKKINGMLHLDVRPVKEKVLWWRDREGKYNYLKNTNDVFNLLSTLSR